MCTWTKVWGLSKYWSRAYCNIVFLMSTYPDIQFSIHVSCLVKSMYVNVFSHCLWVFCVIYCIWVLSDQSMWVLANRAYMFCWWIWTWLMECFTFVLAVHFHCHSNFQMYNILGQLFKIMGKFSLNFDHF